MATRRLPEMGSTITYLCTHTKLFAGLLASAEEVELPIQKLTTRLGIVAHLAALDKVECFVLTQYSW